MKKVLFIDRDGTLLAEPPDEQVDSLSKMEYLPGVITWLGRIARELDYELVMVTNQDGLGTSSFPEENFWPVQNAMVQLLENEGIRFLAVHIDRSFAHQQLPTRKPGIAMLTGYLNGAYDMRRSFVIGDRITDVQLASNLGCNSLYLGPGLVSEATYTARNWEDIYRYLTCQYRKVTLQRTTSETDIRILLNLDGTGQYTIATGLRFLDHMLEQLARHGGIDLDIRASGDLEVDEHHTIEDTALLLGQAFREALGNKKGIGRYGFMLPMDDCLAQVAIDMGGRPWLEWKASFRREKIGDVPTEMFMHFFKSFSDAALCNLNIQASGKNEHHKIESIFKAFARSLKMAIARTDSNSIPSTKGLL